MKVDDAVDKSDDSQDVGPLQATRAWVTQAENNVIDRLVEAGLVAPLTPGGYENTVLDQIVINLAVPNNLALDRPGALPRDADDHCRSHHRRQHHPDQQGLDGSSAARSRIASVVAIELAHIAMGHHIDTRYAFNDRLLFPDEATFRRIDMYHSDTTMPRQQKEPWSICRPRCTRTSCLTPACSGRSSRIAARS